MCTKRSVDVAPGLTAKTLTPWFTLTEPKARVKFIIPEFVTDATISSGSGRSPQNPIT